ncbi:MAG TPA: ATP-binding protein [Candidatus Saccharimonadales bacterium]|nr:ATP-binding protein [Candidatus Saccharimonadales bacterium]
MGLLRIQNLMSNELAKRNFLSRPPEPPYEFLLNDPTNSIFIGVTKLFNVPFTWSFATLTNPHISVVGITGSGKSFFVKTFLTRASYVWGTNSIIIDWAGEYLSWVKQSGGTVISFSKGDYLNIMDLSGMKPIDRSKQIMNSLDILTDISEYPEQRRLTSEAVEQAYVNFGFNIALPPAPGKEPPTLKDVVSLLEEKQTEGSYAYPAELENAIYRLRQFSRPGEDYFANKSTIDIGKLSSSGLVDLDLSSLPDERFRAMAALFILQTLKEKMRMEGWSANAGLKTIVTLDEAWKIASDERSDAVTIIREGRKYSFGLIVASQNPTDINEAIFSNVGTTIMLRIKFEKFMQYLQGSLNFSDFIKSEIGKLGVGQAAVDMSFNTSVKFPNVFMLNQIVGELPLDTFTITINDILEPKELSDPKIRKEYVYDRITLNSKLVENGLNSEAILGIFKKIGDQSRLIDIRKLADAMIRENVGRDTIVGFLRDIGLPDSIITRVFTYVVA